MHSQISRKADPHGDTSGDVLLDRRVHLAHGAAPDALADGVTPDARWMAVVVAHPARFLQKLQWPGQKYSPGLAQPDGEELRNLPQIRGQT
jgi:hypothetical protein